MFDRLKTKLANRVLFLLFYPAWRNFWHKSACLKKIQTSYLTHILKNNANTKFGIQHSFSEICSVSEYQNRLPISTYEDYTEYIDDIKSEKKSILTNDSVNKFSLSSGTASASKYIPNTQALINEFDCCISVWLCDMYRQFPRLLNGRSFWIITPSTKLIEPESAISKGFDDDSEYFSPLKQWFLRNIFVVPDEVARYCQGENYYFVLAVFLLAEKNLRLISVWNPSVLIILLEKAFLYKKEIIQALETGHLIVPEPMDDVYLKKLEKLIPQNHKRAEEINTIIESHLEKTAFWAAIWPDLTVISAWNSAWADVPAKQVKKLFPKVAFQGKGLLATEACVTFPLYIKNQNFHYVPAFTSHFFEFENTLNKEVKLLHELEVNGSYEVIVTTGGGLYRYRLNDIVTCYGFSNKLPFLRFDGKSNLISDLTGEKLHETHVAKVLQHAFNILYIDSEFYFVAPEISEESLFYTLFIQSASEFESKELQQAIEYGLCENFHYNHCRKLEQLGEVKICRLNDESVCRFYSIIQEHGQFGSFKQVSLRKETCWRMKLIHSN